MEKLSRIFLFYGTANWSNTFNRYFFASTLNIECFTDLFFSVTDHFFDPILFGANPILQVSVFMVVACSVILGISHQGASFMLSMLKYIIQLCFMWEISDPESLFPHDKKLLSGFPIDPHSIEARFHRMKAHHLLCLPQ